jgi:ATP-dependent Clp protease ATP-binding subunit ClpC
MAEELYHTDKALIRFDMSEFGEAHSLSKLLGSPAGYVGYRERNRFTDALREHPYAVVLFDEFDKAHPDVQKILLQILDEGELTDSAGKKISFTHSIIILTSNVSSEMYRHHGLGFGSSKEPDKRQTQDRIREKIKEHFGHALTSRLTAIVPFAPLDRAALSDIMQQQINNIINNLSASHGINITVSVQMIDSLLDQAQTKDHGARDIERIINTVVSDAIASVLSNKPAKKTYRLAQKGEYYQLI